MSARGRMGAIVLILAAVFTLCVGEARAQTADVCRGGAPTAGERIVCTEPAGSTADITIYVQDLTIATTGDNSRGIFSRHYGTGAIDIDVRGGTVTTEGADAYGVYGARQLGSGDVAINAENLTITTKGLYSYGAIGLHTGTGAIDIDVQGGIIETEGDTSHGVYGLHQGSEGDIRIKTMEAAISMMGANAHGINAEHVSGMGETEIIVGEGTTVRADGAGASGVRIGRLNADTGAVERAAGLGADGYRRQTVVVNGRVFGGTGEGAGVYLAGGGRVMIGPQGSVGAASGIAILATGDTPVSGEDPLKPKLHVSMDLDDRRVAAVFGDDWIVNDGGVTTIVVDGVTLHDANGATGRVVPNGARDVTIQAEGVTVDRSTGVLVVSQRAGNTILGRSFSVEDFIEGYAPRSAVYEGLPGFLLRLNGRGASAVSGLAGVGEAFGRGGDA